MNTEKHQNIFLRKLKTRNIILKASFFSLFCIMTNTPAHTAEEEVTPIVETKKGDHNHDGKNIPQAGIEILPDEIMVKIMEEIILSAPDKQKCLKDLASVSKRWEDIVSYYKLKDFLYKVQYGIIGNEAIYQRFLNGALIYRPDPKSDAGKITLPIRNLTNPLEGTFDLLWCGDTGKYLSISTGYRKGKNPANAGKLEIWFAPRFLIEKDLNTTAQGFKDIFPAKWPTSAEVGIFLTWGNWAADDTDCDYLTTKNMDNLSKIDLYEEVRKRYPALPHRTDAVSGAMRRMQYWFRFVRHFSISCFFE